MKKILTIMISGIFIFSACKKEKKTPDPVPVPTPAPVDSYDPPPAGGDFYMFKHPQKGFCWTKNFTDFTLYSSKYTNAYIFGYAGDTLLIYTTGKVSFGNVYNPADFRSVNCSKAINSISWIKGVVVCTAVDGNNVYTGFCDYKNGATEIQFSLLNSGTSLATKLNYVGHAVVIPAVVNGNNALAITTNGYSWSYKGLASTFPIGGTVRKYGNTFYAYSDGYRLFSTTDTSFASGSWVEAPVANVTNNSCDSVGFFSSLNFRKQGNDLISYGFVNATNYLPAKNISTDNGLTYTTTLLNGIPYSTSYQPNTYAFTRTHAYVRTYDNTNTYKAYVSSDFINFTLITNTEAYEGGLFYPHNYFE